MFNFKKTIYVTVILSIIILSSCQQKHTKVDKVVNNDINQVNNSTEKEVPQSSNYYLSLNLSTTINDTVYDIYTTFNPLDNSADEVYRMEATSQYAMGLIDKKNNKLYYVSRVKTKNKECDQIFEMDIKSKKRKQLTTEVEAINNMLLIDNRIYFLASRFNNFSIEFGYYSILKNKCYFTTGFDYKDTMTESVYYDNYSKKFYISTFSWKENHKRLWHFYDLQDAKVKGAYFKKPPRNIYELNMDGKVTKKIATIKERSIKDFSFLAHQKKGLIVSDDSKDNKRSTVIFNDINKIDEGTEIDKLKPYRNIQITPDGESIYCTSKDPDSGDCSSILWRYDLNNHTLHKLYTFKDSYISNYTIVPY